jgi:Nitrate/TMAO reductases, membrane-bound tetraheme cytochrome c subunit
MIRKAARISGTVAIIASAFIAGCGTNNKEGGSPATVAKVDEAVCAQCHSTAIDPVAGTQIYPAYLASSHYTNNFHTVGCQDCHGGGAQHNGVGPIPYTNPDTAGKCYSCHTGHLTAAHYTAPTTSNVLTAADAMYVSTNYQTSCTSCHDPHLGNNGILDGKVNTLTGQVKGTQHVDWAESGHGDVKGVGWTTYDFKNRKIGNSYTCLRCHTSTGFINFVQGSYANPFPTTTWAKAGDASREVLTCKACHTDYNFKNRVRRAATYTAAYGLTGTVQTVAYPDAATSNLCVSCHTGMINEASIEAVTDFTNTDFSAINPHYLAAAAILYMKVGFKYYSDPVMYAQNFSMDTTQPGTSHYAHDKIGVDNWAFPNFGSPTGTRGPCISCHMNSGTHTLDYRQGYINADGICTKCHVPSAGHAMTDTIIEEEKAGFNAALDLLEATLSYYGMPYTAAYPYFANKNWNAVGPALGGTGKQNMGAAFNFSLLKHEPGAFAHNRTYAKRLIFDSIDYLQHGAVTGSIDYTAAYLAGNSSLAAGHAYLRKENVVADTRP